jgi:hypothetical protein
MDLYHEPYPHADQVEPTDVQPRAAPRESETADPGDFRLFAEDYRTYARARYARYTRTLAAPPTGG